MPGAELDDPKIVRVVEAGSMRGIEVRPLTFPAGTRTAADAAREVGCEVAQIAKSLVFEAAGARVCDIKERRG